MASKSKTTSIFVRDSLPIPLPSRVGSGTGTRVRLHGLRLLRLLRHNPQLQSQVSH